MDARGVPGALFKAGTLCTILEFLLSEELHPGVISMSPGACDAGLADQNLDVGKLRRSSRWHLSGGHTMLKRIADYTEPSN